MNIYLKLIWAYIKIGLFGFGGGYAMLSLIRSEIVQQGWLSEEMFTDIVAISQMTPGPIGINSATYIGYVATGNVWGSLLATITVVLPSFLLTLYAGHYIARHKDGAVIRGAFMGLRPVVVGLIASAALLLMNHENFGYVLSQEVTSVIICVVSFCVVFFTKLHPIFVIIMAGIAGFIIY